MKIEKFARKFARKLGIKNWLTDWEIRVKRDEALTTKLLHTVLAKDSCCVDIGANIGDFLEQFVSLAPEGKHLAFEPISLHAASLSKRYPQVEVYECALSNKEGSATFFHAPDRDAWSGLKKQRYPDNVEPVETTVSIKRLDDLAQSKHHIDFIKIDVEGAEYEVLEGAKETLKRHRPTVLFEHAKLHNENYETTPEMIFELLNGECGMKIYNLELSHEYSKNPFIDIYERSYVSNYDRNAETNFVARFDS